MGFTKLNFAFFGEIDIFAAAAENISMLLPLLRCYTVAKYSMDSLVRERI